MLSLERIVGAGNFGDHRIGGEGSVKRDGRESIDVPRITIDDAIGDEEVPGSLLWIDVQGYEVEVLRGATSLIRARRPIVLEYWPRGIGEQGHDVSEIAHLLCDYRGYFDITLGDGQLHPVSDLLQLADVLMGRTSVKIHRDWRDLVFI